MTACTDRNQEVDGRAHSLIAGIEPYFDPLLTNIWSPAKGKDISDSHPVCGVTVIVTYSECPL